jgi:hypothetical protein
MNHRIKLTNQISSSLVIEDIGVKLNGKGDFRIVDSETALKSKDLIRMSGLVKQEKVSMPKIWPFASNPPSPSPPKPQPLSIQKSEPIQVIDKGLDQSEIISELSSKMDKILQMLSDKSNQPPIIINQSSSSVTGKSQTMKKSEDPIFIPNKILPDTVDSKINMETDEIEKDNIDNISKKLSSLLRKK